MFSIDSTWLRYGGLRVFGALLSLKSIILDWILLLSLIAAPEAPVPDAEWSAPPKRYGSLHWSSSFCMFKCWAGWGAEAYDGFGGSFADGCVCERPRSLLGFSFGDLLRSASAGLAPLVLKYFFTALWITAEVEHGEAMLSKKPWDIGTLDFESSLKSTRSSGAIKFFCFFLPFKCFEPEMLRYPLRYPLRI